MLIRRDEEGVLAIGQASHAWISGQLARAWGNDRFGAVAPWEEVCLAAEQHDVGMARWDLGPTRNPETGLPHSFLEMPLEVHLKLWSRAASRLESQCRYAALLVSMHGRRLYARRDLAQLTQAQAQAVSRFIDGRREYERRLAGTLSAGSGELSRNSQLIWVWDYLSLALCLDWAPATAKATPTANGPVDLELRADPTRARTLTLAPWPFASGRVTVRCEGRRLADRYESDETLRETFEAAPWETLEFELLPLSSEQL